MLVREMSGNPTNQELAPGFPLIDATVSDRHNGVTFTISLSQV
jgi:hypothetical protein